MPLREFRCKDCNRVFETLILKPSDEAETECPVCRSKRLERLVSVFGVAGTEKGNSSCSSCRATSCSSCKT